MRDNKTAAVAQLVLKHIKAKPKNILVVGCGAGLEAAILAREFSANVTGIDLEDRFDPEAARQVNLKVADATAMPFEDQSFDFVYSYHALEHIPDFRTALKEMRRVLAPGGNWCVGTPNRSRLLGYVGSKNATLKQKIYWNFVDWKKRLQGQFRNECGAHAGFTSNELSIELAKAFGSALDVTLEYYLAIYPNHQGKISLIHRSGSGNFLFPSVYFTGTVNG